MNLSDLLVPKEVQPQMKQAAAKREHLLHMYVKRSEAVYDEWLFLESKSINVRDFLKACIHIQAEKIHNANNKTS